MQFTVKAWNTGWRTWITLNANELTWIALAIGAVVFTQLFVAR